MKTEPILLKAGDSRVMINGEAPKVDCRIISEENYQELIATQFTSQHKPDGWVTMDNEYFPTLENAISYAEYQILPPPKPVYFSPQPQPSTIDWDERKRMEDMLEAYLQFLKSGKNRQLTGIEWLNNYLANYPFVPSQKPSVNVSDEEINDMANDYFNSIPNNFLPFSARDVSQGYWEGIKKGLSLNSSDSSKEEAVVKVEITEEQFRRIAQKLNVSYEFLLKEYTLLRTV